MTYLIIPSMIFIVTSSKLLSFFFILSSVLLTTFDKLEYMELLVFLFTDFDLPSKIMIYVCLHVVDELQMHQCFLSSKVKMEV